MKSNNFINWLSLIILDVLYLPIFGDHNVRRMSVADAEDEGGDTVASARFCKRVNCILVLTFRRGTTHCTIHINHVITSGCTMKELYQHEKNTIRSAILSKLDSLSPVERYPTYQTA